MNAFEIYQLYTALKLHFKNDKYDFFKYNGSTRVTPATFNKLHESEQYQYAKISKLAEPKMYMVGNFLFNEKKYIRDFNEECYLDYRRFIVNGDYFFKNDLSKLKRPLPTNFNGENTEDIPYIVKLLMTDEVSLHTACVFERLINWTDKTNNILIQNTVQQVKKSHRFFKIDLNNVKKILVEASS